MQDTATTDRTAAPLRRRARLVLLPGLVLALGLGMTYALWNVTRQETERTTRETFRFWTNKTASSIEGRLDSYVQVLMGIAGLFDSSNDVNRQEFHRYVGALRLGERFPGFLGVGFSLFIPASQKDAHIAAIRQEGFPDYAIRPPGERPFYTSVVYMEPFEGSNRQVFGYDMAPNPERWAAAELARDRGQPTLSAKVILKQNAHRDDNPGVLLFMPIYRPNAPRGTVAERRANLLGWAYIPVRMSDLMDEVLKAIDYDRLRPALRIALYDGERPSSATRLFETGERADPDTTPERGFQATRRLDVAGRAWLLKVAVAGAGPPKSADPRDGERTIVLAGTAGSLVLALFVAVQTMSQMRIAALLSRMGRTNRALAEQQRELLWAQRVAQLGNWSYDPVDGQSDWSEGMFWIWGFDPGQGTPTEARRCQAIHPDDRARCEEALAAATRYGEPFRVEFRIRRPDGEERVIATIGTPHRDRHGQIVRISGTDQDITERKRMQDALREQAIRDPLTGLLNRRYLDETLPRELGRCQRTGEPLTIAMLDLDRFKTFNDTYGHEAGDQVLRAVGRILLDFGRVGDLACRYGGEELTLILPGANLADAQARVGTLRATIARTPIHYRGSKLPAVTVSIGLAEAQPQENDAAALLRRADQAMYRAKVLGRNRMEAADAAAPAAEPSAMPGS